MIANILIVFGVLTGVLVVADFIGGDGWRKKVNDWTPRAWTDLDDAKSQSILHWLKSRTGRWIGAGILAVIAAGSFNVIQQIWYFGLVIPVIMISVAIIGAFAGRYIVARLINPNRTRETLGLIAYVVIATAGIRYGVDLIAYLTEPPPRPMAADVGHVLFIHSVIMAAILLWIVAVFPAALLLLAMGTLWMVEFITRRIAVLPKGAVVALSAFITCLGGLLKFLEFL